MTGKNKKRQKLLPAQLLFLNERIIFLKILSAAACDVIALDNTQLVRRGSVEDITKHYTRQLCSKSAAALKDCTV